MPENNKRKYERVNSPNLVSYIGLNESREETMQGMGRTLNVSEGGILLETHLPFDVQSILIMTIGLEDDLMDFKGKLAHSRKREDGKYESGIEFIDMDDEKQRFLKQYIFIFKGQEDMI